MTSLLLASWLGAADCSPTAARTFVHLLDTLSSSAPTRGIARLGAEEVARSFSLTAAETRRFRQVMRVATIDANGRLVLELARPFSFASGDVKVELGSRLEARLQPGAIVRIRGLEADGARVLSAARRSDPTHGPGIELTGRGFLGIPGRRFLPLSARPTPRS